MWSHWAGPSQAIQGSTGVAHTEDEVRELPARGASFGRVAVHPFVPGVQSQMTGRKPG
jgi:hypothetical protein